MTKMRNIPNAKMSKSRSKQLNILLQKELRRKPAKGPKQSVRIGQVRLQDGTAMLELRNARTEPSENRRQTWSKLSRNADHILEW